MRRAYRWISTLGLLIGFSGLFLASDWRGFPHQVWWLARYSTGIMLVGGGLCSVAWRLEKRARGKQAEERP